ncbi:hypothetical protein FB451DRAFT_1172127 [Mycena latifolia]|nr:hypothetical protein FB451DRAFT_1172127 [Mycena latifolia]
MRHRRIVPRGGPLLRAVSEGSGCPPTDLDGYSLLDGNSDGPLTLCLYSLGIPCAFRVRVIPSSSDHGALSWGNRAGLLQSNLSGNNNSCPENLLSGSEIGATIIPGSVRLPISSTTKSPTTAASSFVAPVPVTSQSSTTISDDTSALISGTAEPSLPGREIAGIIVGVIALICLVLALLLCTRRRRKRVLGPVLHLELAAGSDSILLETASEGAPGLDARLNGTVYGEYSSETSSPATEVRQNGLRNKIGAAHRRLITMNDAVSHFSADNENKEEPTLEEAMRQIQAQQARIGMLESELHSQWALGCRTSHLRDIYSRGGEDGLAARCKTVGDERCGWPGPICTVGDHRLLVRTSKVHGNMKDRPEQVSHRGQSAILELERPRRDDKERKPRRGLEVLPARGGLCGRRKTAPTEAAGLGRDSSKNPAIREDDKVQNTLGASNTFRPARRIAELDTREREFWLRNCMQHLGSQSECTLQGDGKILRDNEDALLASSGAIFRAPSPRRHAVSLRRSPVLRVFNTTKARGMRECPADRRTGWREQHGGIGRGGKKRQATLYASAWLD